MFSSEQEISKIISFKLNFVKLHYGVFRILQKQLRKFRSKFNNTGNCYFFKLNIF